MASSASKSRIASAATLEGEALLQRIVAFAREKRAEDVVALDVRGLADYMDYLVLATGRSVRQNQAIAAAVLRGLKPLKVRPLARPRAEDGAWICLDFVDVVFHVFDATTRSFYDLELRWGDAKPVELPEPPRRAEVPAEGDEGDGEDADEGDDDAEERAEADED